MASTRPWWRAIVPNRSAWPSTVCAEVHRYQRLSNVRLTHAGGTAVYLGTPPLCECGVDICDIVKRQKTIRGSFVGTRADLAEALDFAARGVVKPIYSVRALDEIAQVFDELARNEVKGRVVIRCHNVQTSHPQTNSADALRH